jgi:uncharacterized protein YndB with AHSA1/START domain
MSGVTEAVVRKVVDVDLGSSEAFRLFTEGIGTWWPLEIHSIAGEAAETCVFETRQGGRIFERTRDGEELVWGTVLVYEPPHRLVYSWHPGRGEETAQEVEMRFSAHGNGTRVEVEHRGWGRYGDGVAEAIEDYGAGWDLVLAERYVNAAARA